MANMSYCRFENTANDFSDCLGAIEEALDEGISLNEFMDKLSSNHERWAFEKLIRMASEMMDAYENLRES
jgi:hypothetical protein